MGGKMFTDLDSDAPYKREHRNQQSVPSAKAVEFSPRSLSPSDGRPSCAGLLAGIDHIPARPRCLPGFDFLGHGFFSFSAPFLVGHLKRVGPARQAKGCFLWGSQETSLVDLFLGGTANPEGGEAEAEARRAASAQGHSPSRRAREKKGD